MAGVRIRWRGVAKVAAIALVGLVAARLAPGFLRAPEPPPLGADVGLPQAEVPREGAAERATRVPRGAGTKPVTGVPGRRAAGRAAARPRKHRQRPHPRRSRPRPARDAPASKAVIGSGRRHRVVAKPPSRPEKVVESAPPPTQGYVPPAIPEAVAEPVPEPPPPPPSTPGDGSQEFAPH